MGTVFESGHYSRRDSIPDFTVFSKFFIFHSVPPNFEFFEKKSKTNEAASRKKLKKHQNKQEISKFLL